MFKIETHLHSTEVSPCGKLCAEEIVDSYAEAGYSAITVTDHFHMKWHKLARIDEDEKDVLEEFLRGYRRIKELGEKKGLRVFYGAEFRFEEGPNDFLVYNFEPALLKLGKELLVMPFEKFSKMAREQGAVIVEAHPFRDLCTPVSPKLIDAIEVYNSTPRHESFNASAFEYAERHGLIGTSGSDCHRPVEKCRSGILAHRLPEDESGLAQLIRSGNFELIRIEGECFNHV